MTKGTKGKSQLHEVLREVDRGRLHGRPETTRLHAGTNAKRTCLHVRAVTTRLHAGTNAKMKGEMSDAKIAGTTAGMSAGMSVGTIAETTAGKSARLNARMIVETSAPGIEAEESVKNPARRACL